MKILYIHGYGGTPDGPKLDMLRKEYRSATIIAPQHDSVPDHVHELLNGIAATMDMVDDMIIGNSLGGFWANFFSLRYVVPALLINPVVRPSKALGTLGCSFADEYSPYEKMVDATAIVPRTVLLAEDDDVIPYRDAFEYFTGICGVELLKSGGHGMNDPESIAIIKDSIPFLQAATRCWGLTNDDD